MVPDQGRFVVGICDELSKDMEQLRVSGFCQRVSPRDEFDQECYTPTYLWVRRGGRSETLIALFRMTFPGTRQKSLVDSWTGKHLLNLPRGHQVAEISRGVVAPNWRQHGVYRFVVTSMLRIAITRRATHVNVVLAEDCVARGVFGQFGFQELSNPLPVNIQGERLKVVPASLQLAEAGHGLFAAHSAAVERLRSSRIHLQPHPSFPQGILGWTGESIC